MTKSDDTLKSLTVDRSLLACKLYHRGLPELRTVTTWEIN